jgi:hypothetical protein
MKMLGSRRDVGKSVVQRKVDGRLNVGCVMWERRWWPLNGTKDMIMTI